MIIKLFQEKVKRTPEKVIVKTKDRILTYGALNDYANNVSYEINKEINVERDGDKAVLLFEHGTDMIVGTLGALKANKTYIPFDPSYPEKRLLFMLENSEAELIVTNNANIKLAQRLQNLIKKYLKIINIDEIDKHNTIPNPERIVSEDRTAYILYTSGSTGTPKGIVQTHGNVLHFINCYIKNLNITEADNMTLFSSFSHDAAIIDIYSSLLCGATLYPLDIKEQANMTTLTAWLIKEKITIWHSVPTLYRYFINTLTEEASLNSIRYIVLGGESVIEHDIISFKKYFYNAVLINLYGQSESSYNSTLFINKDTKLKVITLGEPVDGTEILVINDDGEEVALLETGEIVIASKYVAVGYWKDEEKTKYSFSDDPDLGKLYWTGDMGRLIEDGNVEFLGRKDYQIKIRGYRIEAGEIETKILSYNKFKEAVVIDRKDKLGEKYLCAYIVVDEQFIKEDNSIISELKEYLNKELPDYMIPSYFIQLDKLPQTPNGKLDRTALVSIGAISEANSSFNYEAPHNEIEEKLVKLWIEVLGIEKIGINDNFFELGGHSLKATNLVTRIHRDLKKEVPLRVIFTAPTIKGISEYINAKEKSIYTSIQPLEIDEAKPALYYSASSAQKRIYTLQQLDINNASYNMPAVLEINGDLDIQKLEDTINMLITRHESLRTSFELLNEVLVQRIHKAVEFKLEILDNELSMKEMTKKFIRAFDLNKAPLLRIGLVKMCQAKQENVSKYILLFDMHHIISDGTSIGILINELTKAYSDIELHELKIQYKDFAHWQEQLFKSGKIEDQVSYWLGNLSGNELPMLNLPLDYPRPSMKSFEGSKISFEITPETTKNLRKLARETGTTMYMLLLAVYNVLLNKYSGQEDIIVGSPIAGRPHADLQNTIGMFVNTLAMRSFPESNKTFKEFLMEVKEIALKAYENQDYQFEELANKLNIPRDMSRNPIFDVVFVMQNMELGEIAFKDAAIKHYEMDRGISKFDMTLTAIEKSEIISLSMEYCTKLFKKETIERFCKHLNNIIQEITENPEKKLAEIQILTSQEMQQLLVEFNNTEAEYPKDKTIHQLFEEQVKKTPNNTAVVYEESCLTYKEINKKANQLARVLKNKGVKPDSIVGIIAEPSIEMIVGMLGILKSGGAYLPIDPNYPADRISFILEDSGAEALLTQVSIDRLQLTIDIEVIDLEDEASYDPDSSDLEIVNTSKDLAYVIYTSGSTGNPKGVMIEHSSLINLCTWYKDYYNVTENDRTAKYAGFGFDASVYEIFPYLTSGASIYMIKEEIKLDIEKLNEFYENSKITISFLPTQICEQFILNDNKSLRCLITGGDKLRQYENKGYMLANNYGPTENTVVATSFMIDKTYNIVPIGSPIANTQIYILDKHNNLQPVGVAGELCISGAGLARGYLNKPELTAEKFVENPFNKGSLMYHTGDLARWLYDGNIEFLGRIDYQVKIRGYRIELGEIEAKLLKHQEIDSATVIAKEDADGNKYLCAYYTGKAELTAEELRIFLSKDLPDYMLPYYFVHLDNMPLSANGKLDRKALLENSKYSFLEEAVLGKTTYEATRNQLEEKLAYIWQEVLGVSKIGINDSFFMLGGDSIKAIQVCARLQRYNIKLEVRHLLQNPTIKEASIYAKTIEQGEINQVSQNYTTKGTIEAEEIELIKSILKQNEIGEEQIEDIYPLSPMQQGMLFHSLYEYDSLENSSNVYFEQATLNIEGEINKEIFEHSVNKLIEKYHMLRTVFIQEKLRKPLQVVLKERKAEIEYIDITELLENEKQKYIDEYKDRDRKKGFDLTKEILLRLSIIKLEQHKYIVICGFHHIIMDGWCLNLLSKEFFNNYIDEKEGRQIQINKAQPYSKFIEWLEMQDKKEGISYWKKYLEEYEQKALVPSTKSVINKDQYQSSEKIYNLHKDASKGLVNISQQNGVTLNTIMQTIWGLILQRYNNTNDVVFGSVVSGRPPEIAGIEEMVGLFINTVPVRFSVKEEEKQEKTFLDAVKELQQQGIEAKKYEYVALAEVQANSPLKQNLIDNLLVFENYPIGKEIEDSLRTDSLGFSAKAEKAIGHTNYNFNFIIIPGEELIIKLSYNKEMYDEEQINRIFGHIHQVINVIISNPYEKLKDIEILTAIEKHQLIKEFNNTTVEYPKNKTIHQLIEEQAKTAPDNIAVVSDNNISGRKSLTYRELNEKANQLASVLISKGVKANDERNSIVGIMMENSLEMIIGILGILKAGAAYLPIDPMYPMDRIEYMLEDSEVSLLLTQEQLVHKLKDNKNILLLDDDNLYIENITDQIFAGKESDIAYIIYTSGSTGKPKGVMVEHSALMNMCMWYKNYYNLEKTDRCTKYAGFSFDASVWEIFPPLITGAAIYMIEDHVKFDMEKLNKYYEDNKITVSFLPTQVCEQFMQISNKSLKCLSTGGDKLKKYINTGYKVVNNYGPTENTVVATSFIMDREYINIPIGKPISNTQIYIVDSYNKLQPIGAAGELCISGASLARGYLNKAELTAEKFVHNPFITNSDSLMYRTGDLARWLPDGNIEFLGRIDHQVKVRGYRIELGEIESELLCCPEIREAVVLAKEDNNGSKYLCAYIVMKNNLDFIELKARLNVKLPDYMIPRDFIKLDNIPLTVNGKVDKKELLNIKELIHSEAEYIEPRNEIEEFLTYEICKILDIDKLGINENLLDRGANSLDIMKITQRIKDKYEIDYNYIFKYPYIAEIAKKVKSTPYDTITHINQLKEKYKDTNSGDNIRSQVEEEYNNYINRSKEECNDLDLSKIKTYKNILLTGATGYLGIYLLKDILESTDLYVTVIIRGKSLEEANNRIKEKLQFHFNKNEIYNKYKNRLQIFNGELSQDMLGLENNQYTALLKSIDCVINSAANVKHFGLYEEFYKANVRVTQNLLDFCNRANKKDYFHISTMSIGTGYIENKPVQFFSEYECDLGQITENHYLNTKLEAEKLVLKARDEGINTTIFRMGNLVFDSESGKCQENIKDNAFYQVLRSLIKLRCIPNETTKYVEFTCINTASKAIISLFNRAVLGNQIFHVNNTNLVRYDEFFHLSSNAWAKLELVNVADFLDSLIKNYDNTIYKSHVDTLLIHTEILDSSKRTSFISASDKTNLILNKLGFSWDIITAEHIKKMLDYGFEIGFFE